MDPQGMLGSPLALQSDEVGHAMIGSLDQASSSRWPAVVLQKPTDRCAESQREQSQTHTGQIDWSPPVLGTFTRFPDDTFQILSVKVTQSPRTDWERANERRKQRQQEKRRNEQVVRGIEQAWEMQGAPQMDRQKTSQHRSGDSKRKRPVQRSQVQRSQKTSEEHHDQATRADDGARNSEITPRLQQASGSIQPSISGLPKSPSKPPRNFREELAHADIIQRSPASSEPDPQMFVPIIAVRPHPCFAPENAPVPGEANIQRQDESASSSHSAVSESPDLEARVRQRLLSSASTVTTSSTGSSRDEFGLRITPATSPEAASPVRSAPQRKRRLCIAEDTSDSDETLQEVLEPEGSPDPSPPVVRKISRLEKDAGPGKGLALGIKAPAPRAPTRDFIARRQALRNDLEQRLIELSFQGDETLAVTLAADEHMRMGFEDCIVPSQHDPQWIPSGQIRLPTLGSAETVKLLGQWVRAYTLTLAEQRDKTIAKMRFASAYEQNVYRKARLEAETAQRANIRACLYSQQGRAVPLQIFRTPHRQTGWGLRSPQALAAGSLVCLFTGELLPRKTVQDRFRREKRYKYTLDLPGGDFSYDGSEWGGPARFLNHCCRPNLEVRVDVIERERDEDEEGDRDSSDSTEENVSWQESDSEPPSSLAGALPVSRQSKGHDRNRSRNSSRLGDCGRHETESHPRSRTQGQTQKNSRTEPCPPKLPSHLPVIAFYALENIPAYTELTFDYFKQEEDDDDEEDNDEEAEKDGRSEKSKQAHLREKQKQRQKQRHRQTQTQTQRQRQTLHRGKDVRCNCHVTSSFAPSSFPSSSSSSSPSASLDDGQSQLGNRRGIDGEESDIPEQTSERPLQTQRSSKRHGAENGERDWHCRRMPFTLYWR